jgi:hypothetical protein
VYNIEQHKKTLVIPYKDFAFAHEVENSKDKFIAPLLISVVSLMITALGLSMALKNDNAFTLIAGSVLVLTGIIICIVGLRAVRSEKQRISSALARLDNSSASAVQQQFYSSQGSELLKEEAVKILKGEALVHVSSMGMSMIPSYSQMDKEYNIEVDLKRSA